MANYVALCLAIKDNRIEKKEEPGKENIDFIALNKSISKLKLLFNFNGTRDRGIVGFMDTITTNLSSESVIYFYTSEKN